MRRENQKLRWLMALTGGALGLAFAMEAARGECLSPSAAAGAAATTVYRCQEADSSGKQLPLIVHPEKSTVVERGASDVPWFEPKPTKTQDPIQTAKKPLEKPAEPSKQSPEKAADAIKADPAPAPAAAAAAETKPVKPKTVKTVKAKRGKVKLAKAKRPKAKLAKAKRSKTAPAKTETAKETPKAEPAKSDDKVIVWTKKDMPLGSRIGNWLGF